MIVTFALIIVVVVLVPLAGMLAGTWLVLSACDETSALRRRLDRAAAGWTARFASLSLDREYEVLMEHEDSNRS